MLHFGLDNVLTFWTLDNCLFWGYSVCSAGCSVVTLVFTHQRPVALCLLTLPSPQMPPDISDVLWGAKEPQLEKL